MITSHRNPLVKRIRKLSRRKYRQQERAFFVEGIRVVLSAIEQRAALDTLVYASELLTSPRAEEAIRSEQEKGTKVVEFSSEVFRSISERDNPVGLGAIIKANLQPLQALPIATHDIYVALDRVSDPGNLGTIVRTVDGMGGAGVILVGDSTDPFHPTAVKASMGALFTVPVAEVDEIGELWEWSEEQGLHTIATSAGAEQSFYDAGYRFPALLLLGSEGEGLPPEALERAELAVTIPMHGAASSLNLAVAAGLLLYQLRRRLHR